jgi:hypothetical protein
MPFARGEIEGVSREERRTAFLFINELERLDPDETLVIADDLRLQLQHPDFVVEQLTELQTRRKLAIEQAQALELERDDGLGY